MQNNKVNKGIFNNLGTRTWAPMPVYEYENRSGCVTANVALRFFSFTVFINPLRAKIFAVVDLPGLNPFWLGRKYG